MSKRKSFYLKMVFVCTLIMLISVVAPNYSSAKSSDGYVDECYGKAATQDNCSDMNENADEDETESASSGIGIFDYIKVLFALILVIGLLVFVLKLINKKNSSYQKNNVLNNLGGLSLGQNKSVQLLQVGNRLFLVGVGEDISLIKEIDNQQEIEQLLDMYQNKQQDVSTNPFLFDLLKKFKSPKPNEIKEEASFNALFSSKLNEIKKERSNELEGWKEKEKNKNE